MNGAERIAAERHRQISVEGWTPEHDAAHSDRALGRAAACYLLAANKPERVASYPPSDWPWDSSWWKPSDDQVRNLEKAGALIAAEIDRLTARTGQAA